MIKLQSFFCISFFLFAFPVQALDTQTFRPQNSSQGGFSQYSGSPTESPTFELGLYYNYAKDPIEGENTLLNATNNIFLKTHSYNLAFSYTYSKYFTFILNVPYHQGTFVGSPNEFRENTLGDVSFSFPIYIAHLGNDFHLKTIPYVLLPTGDKDLYLGEEKASYGLGLALDKVFGKSIWRLNAFYKKRELQVIQDLKAENSLNAGLSYSYDLGTEKGLMWISEINAEQPLGSVEKTDFNSPVEVLTGFRYVGRKQPITFNFGLGKELNEGYGAPDYRIFVGFSIRTHPEKIEEEQLPKKEVRVSMPPPIPVAAPTPPVEEVKEEPKSKVEEVPSLKKFEEIRESQNEILVKLEKVHFVSGSNNLKPSSWPILDRLGTILNSYEKEIELLAIEGHTDSSGSFAANMKLSKTRAEAVRNYLIARGVRPSRMVVRGYGPSRALQSNSTEMGRYNNRRVEFVVLKLNASKRIKIINSDQ